MAEKDIISKTLESYNDVFADILNVFLFNGDQVVLPEELSTENAFSQYKADGRLHGQERDTSKSWNKENRFCIAMYGLENQVSIETYMPLRVMNYDAADYRKQLSADRVERVYPVITLVLYFGDRKWSRYKTLYECVDIPERLKPYVNDYKINIFDMHDITDEQISKFKSDFKQIALYYKARNERQEYAPTDEPLRHPKELMEFFSIFRQDNRFEEVYNDMIEQKISGKGEINMCEVLDRSINKRLKQAIEQMADRMRAFGFDEDKINEAMRELLKEQNSQTPISAASPD